MRSRVEKTLSANDVGLTGTHQAGILVPKKPAILELFPVLATARKNPRAHVTVLDPAGHLWQFEFIYYNNAFFGGTRDEYRLTGMTEFLRRHKAAPGDRLVFEKTTGGSLTVCIEERETSVKRTSQGARLVLRGFWKVIAAKM
jgi:hypothetical protein